MTINYKRSVEFLVSLSLKDVRGDCDMKDNITITRLSALCYYEDYPISEIIRIAKCNNKTFSQTNYPVDIDKLCQALQEVITHYDTTYKR